MPRRANTSALPPSGRESDQNFSDMQSFLSSDPDIAPEQMHRTLHPTPALSPLPTRDEFYMTGITRITPPPPPPDGYRCSICIETLIGEYVLLRRCGHVFHATCIRMWFQGTPRAPACHMDCPLCRTVLYEAVKRPSALSIQGTGSESGETAEMLEPANYRSGQDSEQLQRLAADWGRFGQHLRPAYATPMINVPHQSAVATAEEQLRQLYASTIPQQTQGNVLQYDLLRGQWKYMVTRLNQIGQCADMLNMRQFALLHRLSCILNVAQEKGLR
ncbi:hypothetical protein SNOG_10533 [Parastagonospora nodorum SN15]|uniref:RING-type domain-containing protein n=1 Tax=Phaeosphaeria nodorum (strain SN15 / ATCC MYA-4574 / FGSC 10173) TaxID=321614 RepID=Q0UCI1_PHANO|nr:hypothetical protein SNOG_10533 [Parastagonospora nodorum SN15]EAT81927.1 hypothetical protein SNOG_10533 [Parastagonospora nodorum SN15]